MADNATIRLLDADPDTGRFMSAEDRMLAAGVRIPLIEIPPESVEVRKLLRSEHAFAALVIDGMLLQSLRLQEQAGLRLLGPGDLLSLTESPPSMLVLDNTMQATVPTRLGLLGRDFLLVTRRWPWIAAGLNARAAEQSEHLLTQLMICQLPRVDDRILAMMWLLAESWGRVTGSGTLLPLQLTHSALGGLVGARRPTVTLALRGLTESGAVLRQADGWLLLKSPEVREAVDADTAGDLRPLERGPAVWGFKTSPPVEEEERLAAEAVARAELRTTVARLAADHLERTRAVRARLDAMVASRASIAARRARAMERPLPRRAPSSRPHQ